TALRDDHQLSGREVGPEGLLLLRPSSTRPQGHGQTFELPGEIRSAAGRGTFPQPTFLQLQSSRRAGYHFLRSHRAPIHHTAASLSGDLDFWTPAAIHPPPS